MQSTRRNSLSALLAAVTLLLSAAAIGQECAPVWTAAPPGRPPEYNSPFSGVYTMCSWDDGSGPALFMGGQHGVQRWNGATWTTILSSTSPASPVYNLEVLDWNGAENLFILGPGVRRWNGSQLTLMLGASDWYFSILGLRDALGETIYVSTAARVWRNNGSNWTWLAASDGNLGPTSTAMFDDGDGPALYFGGFFRTIAFPGSPSVPAHGIARFDGTTWSEVGGGVGGLGWLGLPPGLMAVRVIDDGTGPALYAAGSCTIIGGQPCSIARWDGHSWQPLGGVASENNGFVVRILWTDLGDGPGIHVMGMFTQIGDDVVRDVARWDGAHWRPLSIPVPYRYHQNYSETSVVQRFNAGDGDYLYLGGDFDYGGQTHFNGLARYGCICPDRDGDGSVGLSDLTSLLSVFGATTGASDVDFDRDVDLTDLTYLLSNFGRTCP